VRVAVGRALQYMFARATLVAVPVVPFAAVLAYGYKHQDVSLGQLFSGSRGFLVAALTMTGVVLWTLRPRALAAINRTFFRTSLDANRDLGALASELRAARSATEIAELVERAIQRTVGATAATVFLRDGTGGRFVPVRGAACGLAADAACAALLQVGATSLVVGSDQPSSIFALLPAAERAWVEQAGYAVLVPLSGSQDEPLGFVATGAKRGGLAFPHDELSFLAAVASAAALGFEARRVQASSAAHGEDEPASECPACGAMDATHADRCACGAERRTAALPLLLQGRFQVERRLGAGGMGVVYRGRDVALDRGVALKTLSRLSAVAADRLAHEARVMASVVHPNLATIFGVERWRSTPILVVELLEGGTLAARLEKGALPIDQVLRIGLLLAPALEQLHEAGVLHRDVKPSNVLMQDGKWAQLTDFGLAREATEAMLSAWEEDYQLHRHLELIPASDGPPLVADVSMGAVTYGDVLTGAAKPEELVPFGGEHAHKAFALAVGLELLVAALAGPEHGAVLVVARPEHDPVPAFRALAAGLRLPGDRGG